MKTTKKNKKYFQAIVGRSIVKVNEGEPQVFVISSEPQAHRRLKDVGQSGPKPEREIEVFRSL